MNRVIVFKGQLSAIKEQEEAGRQLGKDLWAMFGDSRIGFGVTEALRQITPDNTSTPTSVDLQSDLKRE